VLTNVITQNWSGIAVAQQMVKTMNSAMQNMYVPGAMNPIQTTPQTFLLRHA